MLFSTQPSLIKKFICVTTEAHLILLILQLLYRVDNYTQPHLWSYPSYLSARLCDFPQDGWDSCSWRASRARAWLPFRICNDRWRWSIVESFLRLVSLSIYNNLLQPFPFTISSRLHTVPLISRQSWQGGELQYYRSHSGRTGDWRLVLVHSWNKILFLRWRKGSKNHKSRDTKHLYETGETHFIFF